METNWFEIALLSIIVLGAVALVVVQILRATGRVSEDDADNSEEWIAKWVSIGVYAAEQIFGAKTGEKKLEYVKNLLTMLGIDVGEPELAMIEAAVYNLKQKTEV